MIRNRKSIHHSNICTAALLVFLMFQLVSYAQEKHNSKNSSLKLLPIRCVALRQGQECYQEVTLSWQARVSDEYCLYRTNLLEPLHCWKNVSTGKVTLDIRSKESVVFSLRKLSSKEDIAKATLTVAWVYGNKKRRRTSWRLF